jgi:hypothetical protein
MKGLLTIAGTLSPAIKQCMQQAEKEFMRIG